MLYFFNFLLICEVNFFLVVFLLQSSKPQMEKRRRARINDSLGQLKALILEATNKDVSIATFSNSVYLLIVPNVFNLVITVTCKGFQFLFSFKALFL